ncbi:unnamed protein product, partial [Ectocarpus fasciculatus]
CEGRGCRPQATASRQVYTAWHHKTIFAVRAPAALVFPNCTPHADTITNLFMSNYLSSSSNVRREKMGFLTARAPPSLTFFDNYGNLAWRGVARKGLLCSDHPT